MSVLTLCNMRCWIYSVSTSRDVYGANTETYTQKYSNVPCRARYVTGQESIIDGKEMNVPIWRIYLGKQYTLLHSDLIVDEKNRKWDILYINKTDRKRHMQIDCGLVSQITGDFCPNVIKSVNASIIVGDPGMVLDKWITIEQNGSTSKDHFLPLYTYSTVGKTMSDKTFFGDTNTTGKNSDYYESLLINGTKYWIPIYNGVATSNCCSNIIGEIPV